MRIKAFNRTLFLSASFAAVAISDPGLARGQSPAAPAQAAAAAPADTNDGNALLGDIVVTATKKARAEQLQKVSASITAYGAAQLQAVQFRSLKSLTTSIPNVALDEAASTKGTANFTIRGLGVNSSVPSIEPTVGTFVNGIYLGTNYGVMLDAFDVDSVEVLRGPQGVLFGRNVTGGAVSLNTRRPTGKTEIDGKISFESGLQQTYGVGAEAPIVKDRLFARIAGYWSHDNGYFKDPTIGRNVGRSTTWFVRPTLVAKPVDGVDMTFIGEAGKVTGDAAVIQNGKYAQNFTTVINNPGLTHLKYLSGVSETNVDVGIGEGGKITNILGYRKVDLLANVDADAAASRDYDIYYKFHQHQFSEELRFSGRFLDRIDLVTGLFYFNQRFKYIANDRLYYSNLFSAYGGIQRQSSFGIFANADVDIIPDKLVLTAGGRYSSDRKRVNIAVRNFTASPCNFDTEACTFGFNDSKTFKTFSPKVALKWMPTNRLQFYALYSRGYRSGGYNIRPTTPLAPGPFDDEKSDNFEVGAKMDLFDRKVRLNVSAFHNVISGMQREETQFTSTGIQTIIANTANARLQGFEAELTAQVARHLTLRGSVGYTDGDYTKIFADLNGDGLINDLDKALKIPRLAPLSYSIGAILDVPVQQLGRVNASVTFDHRDGAWFNDKNTGFLPSFGNLSANLSFSPESMPDLRFSVYGKNLLNRTNLSVNVPAPTLPAGGNNLYIGKGRVIGGEINFKF